MEPCGAVENVNNFLGTIFTIFLTEGVQLHFNIVFVITFNSSKTLFCKYYALQYEKFTEKFILTSTTSCFFHGLL